jgi:tetratricopeptide (TPR) repeat protein
LEFPDGKGSHPYSLRGFGRIDGQWKNIGEDRCPSLNAAKSMFMNKKDNYRKRFEEIAGPEATNAAQPPSAADKREGEKLAVQAWKLWNQQKFDEAEPLFQQAIQKDPTNANTWNGLGWSQFNQGKGLNAQHSFERCLALEPKHAAALNGLGWAAKAAGKNEEAINYWRKAIAACPTATAPLRGLAITLDELGKTDEAIQQYRQWLRVEPDNQEAKAGLQKALAKAKGDK